MAPIAKQLSLSVLAFVDVLSRRHPFGLHRGPAKAGNTGRGDKHDCCRRLFYKALHVSVAPKCVDRVQPVICSRM